MAGIPGASAWRAALLERPLLCFLPVQCGLLFYNLDLLPIWGDEQFTLHVTAKPWAAIPPLLQPDIHPPAYYFLARLWIQLPWPGSDIAQLRALSALLCLGATVVVHAFWLRGAAGASRLWFSALWCLSPTLLMYSRMARSYSLQLLMATLGIHCALRLIARPSSRGRVLAYALAAAGLLYTHYLPAISVIGATALTLAWRWVRRKRSEFLRALLVSHAIAALLYLPWAGTFAYALSRVSQSEPYWLVQNFALETAVKLAYWFTAFTFGEAFPPWAIFLGAALGPAVLWLLRQGVKAPAAPWLPLAALAALIGYLGAASWVSFPFMGARLLFMLPFYLPALIAGRERSPLAGNAVCAGLLVVSLGSLSAYFGKQGFLNQGYLVPFDAMARRIEEKSPRSDALLLADGYNTDPSPLLAALDGRLERLTIYGEQSETLAAKHIREERFETVWYLRNTHDSSPGNVVTRLERQAAERYAGEEHLFAPYAAANRWAARLLGRPPRTHHYRLTEFRKTGEGP